MVSDTPPPPNPILDAYESFSNDTPWVTRNIMISQVATWMMSFLVEPTYPLANIPYFTIYRFEIYRVILSPLICTQLLSLVVAYFSFVEHGRRLEQSYGSTKFATLLLLIGLSVNCIFLLLASFLAMITRNPTILHSWSSHGIWTLLFAVIEIECAKAPPGSKRNLFAFSVPTEYYPLVIFALFSVMGGFQISYLLSIGVGYLYAKGHLDRIMPEAATLKRCEENQLSALARQKGWVRAHESLGSTVWSEISNSLSTGSAPATSGNNFLSSNTALVNPSSVGTVGQLESIFPSGPGRTLGSATKRSNNTPTTAAADARQARLKALDRATNKTNKDGSTKSSDENVV